MEERRPETPLIWLGPTRKIIRQLPQDVSHEIGYALGHVQKGRTPGSALRMKDDLRDVMEIRVDGEGETYRAMYTTRFEGVIYVLDIFKKKSKRGRRTPRADTERVRQRLKDAKKHYEESVLPEKK